METIKFSPAPLNANGTIDYNHDELKGKPGVYIAGIKIDIKGQGKKFCPLIVGESKNLKNRIIGHRDPNNTETIKGELNSFKELFDFKVLFENPSFFYDDIRIWDEGWISKNHHKREDLKVLCEKVKGNNNSLIWFPNSIFFEVQFGNIPNVNINLNRHNATIKKCNNLLDIPGKPAKDLISSITQVKKQIYDDYFFAFASSASDSNKNIDFKNKKIRETIEDNTKAKLISFGIHTYAKNKNNIENYNIDFSYIYQDFVAV